MKHIRPKETGMGNHLPLSAFDVLELKRPRAPVFLRALAAFGGLMIFAGCVLAICVMVGA